ncbi:glycosyltransferase [Vibrio aestuarianus subsp. cardii]|uniref:glycosyltransferase family 2 protein n=1 Tax=Vibrio aestuarianus TaxID=28171 RepID=UPI0015934F4E|nr:glycosyltransferase [Vibrio aestuarianus]MDE1309873.1 glycosyltransferase [Vibrio aestuarianus]NGZ18748.1 glycosyltransferase [Vibrio aestuarianus]NGZ94417.1 glycosyltransferase [Vibrio aestuarianus subsp. cardii]
MKPLVSICIPTYNSAQYIEDTLKSITKQTYENIEIIIGDNASDDDTEQIIRRYILEHDSRITYYKNVENIGAAGNCNKLIHKSNGDFIAIYHSDDIYSCEIVEKQVDYLIRNEKMAGCFTNFSMINSDGEHLKSAHIIKSDAINKYVVEFNYQDAINSIVDNGVNPFCCPSSMIRKSTYDFVGGYDEKQKYIFDQDMWIRILECSNLAVINEPLIKYRIHSKQLSHIYTDISRSSDSPMIEHISQHLICKYGQVQYKKNYKAKINRLLAVDDIRFAFHLLKKNRELADFNQYKKFIVNSKKKYLFKVSERDFLRFSLFQWLPMRVTYCLLKTINKVTS